MTDRDRQDLWLREYRKKYPFGDQDESGVDLSQLRQNLKLSPGERLRKHDQFAMSVLELMRAGQNHRRKNSGNSA
jgi:hypothetical protein